MGDSFADMAVDVNMAEDAAEHEAGDVEVEVELVAPAEDAENGENGVAANGNGPSSEHAAPRITFAEYLASPVVKLVVGGGEGDNVELTAHQAQLERSPYFAALIPELDEDRTISLDQNLDAVGCFLEYLYTGDYFPRKVAGHAHSLESDPTVPEIDETGDQLLKHARVYTLAEEFTMPDLQSLASSKIHCVQSTAQGEIAYARYVYAYTKPEDTTVRHPVAKFWAMRSHTLRAEAEKEFQALCLEHPLFAYDVLTRVLDEKLKRERDDKMYPASSQGSARKRARNSSSVQ